MRGEKQKQKQNPLESRIQNHPRNIRQETKRTLTTNNNQLVILNVLKDDDATLQSRGQIASSQQAPKSKINPPFP